MGSKPRLKSGRPADSTRFLADAQASAESRLRAIIEATPECVKLVDPEGRLLEMNEAGLRMIDCDHLEDVVGKLLAGLIIPEDRATWMRNHKRVCSGESLRWEFSVTTPKGRVIILESNAVPMIGPGGLICQLAVTRDVTNDRKALEDLRESEAKWHNLFNSMQEGFIVVEFIAPLSGELRDFRIVEANAQWEKMTGIPIQQVFGKPIRAAIPGLEEFWFEAFAHVARTGEAVTLEQYTEALKRWFEVRVYAHSPSKLAAVFLNITERKLAQAAAEQARQEKMRASRLTAMGAMASTLAHELNQPLATSANYLGALLMQLDGGQLERSAMRNTASKALEACLRAGDIIRRTRSFTMEGRVMSHREGLASIVEESVSDFRQEEVAAGVEVKVEPLPDGELLVECDRVQIEQVFSNLLRNAAQAMRDAPEKRIIIRLAKRGQKAVVRVEDSGPGFSPENAKHMFNPFSSSKRDGLGLGLALCRTIIEAHDGTIHGMSRSQGGAVFEVSLPASA